MLEELGAPYEVKMLNYGPEVKSPDYLAVNGMGKVPALKHGEKIITEAAAICAYLADAFPAAGLAPALEDRADYYRWLFFCAGPMDAAWFVAACKFGDLTAEQQSMSSFGDFQRVQNAIELAIKGKDYIAGNKFSAVDVFVGASLGFGMRFDIIEKRPEYQRYVANLQEREAYKRATALDLEAAEAMAS